ncbi:beta/gamma crystallin-related protein [Calothrix sp. 336/3]|uniref:beta/gamma crystallin-related protein n=1 Tax=Calothrix sp. 336/3 TaxID=1337936 RepID=UPI0004E2F6F9|nr:beta/gamma crystallin-related protein [Calothrix sp. 336/3]AKG21675.1 hypothetical protein IJ00_10760 [Calothrix sp. 336/3]
MYNINKNRANMNNNTLAQLKLSALNELSDEVAANYIGGEAYESQGDPDIILYEGTNYGGRGKGFNATIGDGHYNLEGNGFNDITSSLKIIRGQWSLFVDKDYNGQSILLGPGDYPNITEKGLPDNSLSSILRAG